jgi:hypothetical protein
MIPNQQQIAALIRLAFGTLGGAIIGWFAARGFTLSSDEQKSLLDLLQSPELIGVVISGVTSLLTLLAHTHQAAVATVAQIAADPKSSVVGVVTTNDPAGNQLALSIPQPTVAPATTALAGSIAQDDIPPLTKKGLP